MSHFLELLFINKCLDLEYNFRTMCIFTVVLCCLVSFVGFLDLEQYMFVLSLSTGDTYIADMPVIQGATVFIHNECALR